MSSRIENYLGFPSGISGAELAERAETQALKFGTQLSTPCEIVALDIDEHLHAVLADRTTVATRALIIASGARYRSLALERWDEFAGAGIFYAATERHVALSRRPAAREPEDHGARWHGGHTRQRRTRAREDLSLSVRPANCRSRHAAASFASSAPSRRRAG